MVEGYICIGCNKIISNDLEKLVNHLEKFIEKKQEWGLERNYIIDCIKALREEYEEIK